MPTYDYECAKCGHLHEQLHGMAQSPQPCPECGWTRVVKVFMSVPRAKIPDKGWEYENGGRGRYIARDGAGSRKFNVPFVPFNPSPPDSPRRALLAPHHLDPRCVIAAGSLGVSHGRSRERHRNHRRRC